MWLFKKKQKRDWVHIGRGYIVTGRGHGYMKLRVAYVMKDLISGESKIEMKGGFNPEEVRRDRPGEFFWSLPHELPNWGRPPQGGTGECLPGATHNQTVGEGSRSQ
jgi:hypothetical protein